ncbi:MAG: hypothetical protein RIS36_689 [Pseudomonadota bacterium]|jgi:hypothetical protein
MTLDQENSLHILLASIFDYAGMFPPVSRPFEAAIKEACSLKDTLFRPWMVASDIVLDTEHAHKLRGVNLGEYTTRNPFRVCIIATEDSQRVLDEVSHLVRKEPPVVVSSIEVRASPEEITDILEQYGAFCSLHDILLCVEPNLSVNTWQDALNAAVTGLKASPYPTALKCRLTGPNGIGTGRFTAAIISANESGVPLKVTGGLHHPIVEPERYPFPMGFLNVSVGVMLHRHLGKRISSKTLEEILINQDPKAFTFGDQLGYKELIISLNNLLRAKSKGHFTIGSCSLHEPDADLSRLFGVV